MPLKLSRLKLAVIGLVGAVAIAGCSPIVGLNHSLVPKDGYTEHRDVAYGEEIRRRLDVYVPAGNSNADGIEPARVIIFFYGGSWRSGERAYYRFVGEALASRGFIVVIPDYRLYPEARFPAFIEDGAASVRWVHDNAANYGGDPNAIFLMGHSAGAHIAALLAVDRGYLEAAGVPEGSVRGVIGLSGPYAFDPSRYHYTRPVFATADDVSATQPPNFVRGGEPPMLLLHGSDDGTVLPLNSHALADRLRAAGSEARVIEYPDVGHIGLALALAKPFRRPGGVLDVIAEFIATR